METIIQCWLSVWLYVMLGIGIVLIFEIVKNRKLWTDINILCTAAVVVLIFHVIEEWVLPGGLHYSYNIDHGSDILDCYPMNRLTDMITNFGGVLLGCIVLKFWGFRTPAGIAVMLFSAFETVIHIVIGITSLKTFGEYGMNVIYSPGLITSLFGFLPITIGLAKALIKIKPKLKQWFTAIAVMFCFCFLLINLPEMLLGDKNSSYKFTDRGYYERYGEQYETDHNITYGK